MSIKDVCKFQEPIYYHREYTNDIKTNEKEPKGSQTCKRVALASLPFFSLYRPLSLPISLAMGTTRSLTEGSQLVTAIHQGETRAIAFQLFQTSISIASLAGTIFAHPAGMLLSTGHDIFIETASLLNHLQKGNYQKATECCAKIINNALYLAVATHGGLELAIASFALQTLIGLYYSHQEFKKGNTLEGCSHLLMAMVRANQLHSQVQLFQIFKTIESSYPDAPKEIILLVKDVLSEQQSPPFVELKSYWEQSTLQEKDFFVQIFNHSQVPHFQRVREGLADLVYQPSLTAGRVEWLSPEEVDQRIGNIWSRSSGTSPAFYYHATSRSGLKGILQTQQVEVRHEQAYRGAFVSTEPEITFGNCILAFNRTIERKSAPITSFHWFSNRQWAGFGEGIPVTQDSLSCVIWNPNYSYSQKQMTQDVRRWAGWEVPIITMQEYKQRQAALREINMGVPKEWPDYITAY